MIRVAKSPRVVEKPRIWQFRQKKTEIWEIKKKTGV